jgi:hypothetical protein
MMTKVGNQITPIILMLEKVKCGAKLIGNQVKNTSLDQQV